MELQRIILLRNLVDTHVCVYNYICTHILHYFHNILCDRIWEKLVSTNTTARHMFNFQIMAASPLYKQTGGCNSPHKWLIWILLLCMICWAVNGTNGSHFDIFSVYICSLDLPLYGSHRLQLSTPIGMYCGIGYASKNLYKMVGNSASYPFNSWCIGRLWRAIELWRIACMQAFVLLNKIQYFK